MRILHILDITYPSGTSKHVLMLTSALRERGHDVMVLCPGADWLEGELRTARIPHLPGGLRLRPFIANMSKYLQVIRNQNFDVIHSHMTRAAYCAALLGGLTRTPVVASVHTITHDIVYRRILPFGKNRIVCVSDFLRNSMLRQHIPPQYLKRVYNATDYLPKTDGIVSSADSEAEPCAVRAELEMPADAEIVGLFGHGDRKGISLLIRAAREISRHRPRAQFVFVGHILAEVEHSFQTLAASEGVKTLVRFTGSRTDIPRLMRAMDIITLPSEMETFGMVLIEGMALGKPVVGTNVGGIPELIRDKETGLIVEQTPEALSAAIIGLLEDPAGRAAMGEAGQARVRDCFSVDRMTTNFELLYREMLCSDQD